MANVEIDGVNSKVYTDQVDPKTGTTLTLGTSGDTVSVPSGVTIANSGTATGFGITQTSFLPTAQPLIINGDTAIATRSTSVASITGSGYNTCDRWKVGMSSAGTWTQTQSTDVPSGSGFGTSFKMDCTTADASLGAGDWIAIIYNFEGQDLQLIKKGTASAEKMTLAFWIKSTKTGTFIANLYDNDNTRQCSISYTVDVTNTWEKKIVNLPADTTGAFGNDNALSLSIYFWLGAGSNYTSGSLGTTWAAYSAATTAVGQVNCADSTSNDVLITGVQMEVGEYTSSDLPPFRHESYGANLARCQRYFNIFGNVASKPMGMAAFNTASAVYVGPLTYPVEMRSSPTIAITGGGGGEEATAGFVINHSGVNDWFQTFSSSDTSTKECQLYGSAEVSATDGDAGRCKTGNIEFGKVTADAEL